jgi:hypothetical protein
VPDLEPKKKWVHGKYTNPKEARQRHKSIDGELVAVDKKFSIGYNPRESGSASNDYNCGCGVETIFNGETFDVEKVFIRKRSYDFDKLYDTGSVHKKLK